MLTRSDIALGVLAGGKATRMGGADKARVSFGGCTLLQGVLHGAGPGFAETLLSYNRDASWLEKDQGIVVPDRRGGSHGPLAGIESLLHHARTPWLLTLPVDLRNLLHDLPERMAAEARDGRGVAVVDADGLQPLVGLWPVAESLRDVAQALDAGNCAVHAAVLRLGFFELHISPISLGNLNTRQELDKQ